MKVLNVALTAAQVGVQAVSVAAMYPLFVVNGAATAVKVVASAASFASEVGVGVIVTGMNRACDKLESYKTVEEEVVQSPWGDSAKSVN